MDKETILQVEEHLAKFRFSSKRYGLAGQIKKLDKLRRRRGLTPHARSVLTDCWVDLRGPVAYEDPAAAVLAVRRKLWDVVIQNQRRPPAQIGKAYW